MSETPDLECILGLYASMSSQTILKHEENGQFSKCIYMHQLFPFLVVVVVSRAAVKIFAVKNVISAGDNQVTGTSYS